jgi:two-component system phosphate regulon sensor histidine kinase PhoR
MVEVLAFLLGLALGLALWGWQQLRLNREIGTFLRGSKLNISSSATSFTSQLGLILTRQQYAQRQLEQQIETLRQILHSAPIGYLQVDEENRLLWCNPQVQGLLEIHPDHTSKLPRLLLEVVRSYELDQLIDQTRNDRKPYRKDWIFYPVSSDPSRLSKQQAYALRGYSFPLPEGHVGVFLENRQEALILRQQRDRWASDVAHELKTPLTSIRLVAETLQSRLDPGLRGWVERLINETIRLSNLVQDLLDLSQIDRAAPDGLHFKTVDLVELIQNAWLNLEPLARKKQLHLDYQGPSRLLLEGDEQRLFRVLINLLDNSIKYSPPWQHIRVYASIGVQSVEEQPSEDHFVESLPPGSLESQVCVEVIDAGPGFPEDALPYVFERFYRVDPARAQWVASEPVGLSMQDPKGSKEMDFSDQTDLQHKSSSGLGLAIVKQIIEAHQGHVNANNHPETGGAWLKVYLPVRQPNFFSKN